jgi:hypothetical protein
MDRRVLQVLTLCLYSLMHRSTTLLLYNTQLFTVLVLYCTCTRKKSAVTLSRVNSCCHVSCFDLPTVMTLSRLCGHVAMAPFSLIAVFIFYHLITYYKVLYNTYKYSSTCTNCVCSEFRNQCAEYSSYSITTSYQLS